jgi:hypothetical protein
MFTAMGKAGFAMVRACTLLWGKQGLLWKEHFHCYGESRVGYGKSMFTAMGKAGFAMVRAFFHCYGESRCCYGKSIFTAMGKAGFAMVRA